MRIAIDTGGTFTDCVYLQDGVPKVLKLFSTPANPANAVVEGLRRIQPGVNPEVRHGTTVGTNAVLERKGARVAFVTTEGFEDTVVIGRQARANLYDWFATPPPPLVPAGLRFGVHERTCAEGKILQAPSHSELERLCAAIQASGAEAVAVSLLFAFANPANERMVAEALDRLGIPVSRSHVILPEFREYERATTVVVNAYLSPKMGHYIRTLEDTVQKEFKGGQVKVMQSSGGIVSARLAAAEPVRTVLSGPAGGVMGAYHVARLAGFDRIIGFDMGGTSTDVSLVDASEGGPHTTNESIVSGMPISVPMLDIHTVGAGGGSLARFDSGGALTVGPESAGSDPGPICYGRGTQPTVTDANLLLGRLDPDMFLGGAVRLDEKRTRALMEQAKGPVKHVEEFAAGILRLAETTMEKAIRVISVERGYDPRDFTLVCFGGAGPLHACALARALHIPRVLVPCMPGALSALGILMADTVRDYSRTVMQPPEVKLLEKHFEALEKRGHAEMKAEGLRGVAGRSIDVRYVGQGYELNIPFSPKMLADFHRAHRQRYGYADEQRAVEIVNVRVRMVAAAEPVTLPKGKTRKGDGQQAVVKKRRVVFDGTARPTPVYDRHLLRRGDTFRGPAVIAEYSATTVVPPGCSARVDAYENIVIEVN